MIFYSFFKTLVGKEVTVELKNDLSISGVLHSVDQYLNIKLTEISVGEPERHPQARGFSSFFPFFFSPFSSLLFRASAHRGEQPRQNTTNNKRQLATVKNVFIRGSVVRYVKVKKKRSFFRSVVAPTSPRPLFFPRSRPSLSLSTETKHASSPPTASTPSSSTTRRGGRRGGSKGGNKM